MSAALREKSFALDVEGAPLRGLVQDDGIGPVGVFVHGFRSSMLGRKAQHFTEHAASKGYNWLRFDLHGHGEANGPLSDFRVSRALAELQAVLQMLAPRRLLLTGSSFGGWLAALAAQRFAPRVGGLLLLAPAFDFIDHYFAGESPEVLAQWRREGRRRFTGLQDGELFELDYELLRDARQFRILDKDHDFPFPIHILHGEADDVVPLEISRRFTALAKRKNVVLESIENGDHSLSDQLPRATALVDRLLGGMTQPATCGQGSPA